MKKIISFIAIFLLISVEWAVGQPWKTELDSVLTLLNGRGLFNGQLLLAEQDEILFSKGYGYQELDSDSSSISTDTPLPLASVTKPFTAMGIMMLEERGKLKYDDPISTYIPTLPWSQITLRHLLNQTGGIPRGLAVALEHGDTTQVMYNEDIIAMLGTVYDEPDFTPGEHFAYNNLNFILLAAVIEQVTGEPYADFLRKNIWRPLEMTDTYDRSEKQFSENNKPVGADNFYRSHGTGSMLSTAEDLYRFDRALYSKSLVSNKTMNEAFTPPVLNNGDQSTYGFGWFIEQQDASTSIYHLGEGDGFSVYFQRFPDQKRTLILNHTYPSRHALETYRLIRNIWEGKDYTLPTARERYNIDPGLFKAYVGSYQSNFGLVHVTAENGKLYLRPDPVPGREELVPSSDSTFYFNHQNLEWQFYRDGEGEVIGFGIKGQPENMGTKQE